MKRDPEKSDSGKDPFLEIKALEHKLSLLMMNSEESFILVDTEFNIVAFNRQFKNQYIKYFGTEVKQGTSILNLVMPDRVEKVKNIYRRVFAGSTEESELEIPLPNKETLVILNRYKPAFDEGGKIIGAFVTTSDMSGLRKAEREKNEALKQIEFDNTNFRALIDNSSDMIWSFDQKFRLITSNKAFDEYVKNLTGKNVLKGSNILLYFIDKDGSEKFAEDSRKALNGETFTITDNTLAPNEMWREIRFNPIVDSTSGLISGVACIARDITERIEAEKSLLQNDARLRRAQKMTHLGNWSVDLKTQKVVWSEEAERIFGFQAKNLDDNFDTWFESVHPDDKELVKKAVDAANETFKDYQLNYRIIKSNGDIAHIFAESTFEFDESGQAIGIYGIVQDVTDRIQKEIELKELLELTQKQNEWLNNFTYIVSHNIRSNNNNIKSLTELLEDAEAQEEKKQLLDMLKTSTDKLDETIENLAEFVRFQNLSEKNYQEFKLRQEIDKSFSAINHLITDTHCSILNEVDPELKVKAIPSFLESILLNILTNAVKYRSPSRNLELRFFCNHKEDYTELCVQDNGIGIDMNKHKDAIFGLFKTFHNNKDAVGFGLFMTKNQLELMNGKIDLDSSPDQGTIFKLYFYEKN